MLFLIPIAFLSGVLTIFSPCVLPILPVVLASGADGNRSRVNGVMLGLVLSFSVAALFLASILAVLGISADTVRNLSAILLLVLGFMLLFPIWDKIQVRIEKYFDRPVDGQRKGFFGGLLTGISLGIVWTPCVGPIVATVSSLAAASQFSFAAILLVLAYALGIALPLWFIAVKGGQFTSKLGVFRRNPQLIRQIFGVILILTSIFIYSGYERRLQTWFLDNLPEEWTLIATTLEDSFGVEETLNESRQENSEDEKEEETKNETSSFLDSFRSRVGGPELGDLGEGREINQKPTRDDFDPDQIKQGCFGRDCIPSIDDPNFESAEQANEWLQPEDTIFGVNHNGIQRAYPQRIMNWHEIVNDEFEGDPIAVTFCPLCGTAISYRRVVDDEVTEFGVSGKLYNSDLIMYDRNDENYWQQATGEAIVGDAAARGLTLTAIPTTTTTWEKWLNRYPDTEVLSLDTGFRRDYGHYPYGTYEEDQRIIFDVNHEDDTFHRKEVKLGIVVDDSPKAYFVADLEDTIEPGQSIEDEVAGKVLVIERTDADEYIFTDKETGEEVVPLRGFWFAWFAFYPNTEVFDPALLAQDESN